MKKQITIASLAFLLSLGTACAAEHEKSKEEVRASIAVPHRTPEAALPDLAVISLSDALEKALTAVSGKAVAIELEDDDGFLVYEAKIIRADKTIADVTIDAGNGNVLEIEED